MSLSSWATLAFDDKGDPCDGFLKGLGIADVKIYKNWAYVSSEAMWAGGCFIKDTIAQVNEGSVTIGDVEIEASRGPQCSVFVFAESTIFPDDGDIQRKRMAGIGCYGYTSETEALMDHFQVNEEDYDLCQASSCYTPEGDYKQLCCIKDNKVAEKFSMTMQEAEDLGIIATWVGVLPATFEAFIEWLKSMSEYKYNKEFIAWVDTIASADTRPFNQGDAFFVGVDEAMERNDEKPILEKMMQDEKPDKADDN